MSRFLGIINAEKCYISHVGDLSRKYRTIDDPIYRYFFIGNFKKPIQIRKDSDIFSQCRWHFMFETIEWKEIK